MAKKTSGSGSMATDLEKLWRESFDQCGAFVRDTTLPAGFLEKYRVGLLLSRSIGISMVGFRYIRCRAW